MTKHLATRPGTALVAEPIVPRLSPRLLAAIDAVLDPHPDVAGQRVTVPMHTMAEAQNAVRTYERVCQAATLQAFYIWLLPINASVRNPQEREKDFPAKAAVIATACSDIPSVVLTPATQREAMRTFQFFPSAADVYALLRPHAAPLHATRRALATITSDEPQASGKPESQAERDAIVAAFRSRMADVKGHRQGPVSMPDAPLPPPRAIPLSPDDLAASRAGSPVTQAARRQGGQ
jgi:hypothetical protein